MAGGVEYGIGARGIVRNSAEEALRQSSNRGGGGGGGGVGWFSLLKTASGINRPLSALSS